MTKNSHGQWGSLRFSVNASYFSQRRSIRSLIVVRHFGEDNILYTTQCLKYIFIVHMKFAKRNISNCWPWPWLTTSIPSQGSFYSLETDYNPSFCSVLNLTLSLSKNQGNREFKWTSTMSCYSRMPFPSNFNFNWVITVESIRIKHHWI